MNLHRGYRYLPLNAPTVARILLTCSCWLTDSISFWRLRKRRHWSSWGGHWCRTRGRSRSLTDHSDHKSEYSNKTTKLCQLSSPMSLLNSHLTDWRLLFSQIDEAGDQAEVASASGGRARVEEARAHQMILVILPSRSSPPLFIFHYTDLCSFVDFIYLSSQIIPNLAVDLLSGYYDSFSAVHV